MSNYGTILFGKLFYSSLDNFLEHVSALSKEHGWTLEQIFSKGLSDTLTIRHETTKKYISSNHTFSSIWARYSLSPLPGCCGVVVSHDSHIDHDQRGKGLGSWFHKQRLTLMKVLGYSCALCTVTADNAAEKAILTKNKWIFTHSFVNSRTGHTVEIWVKDL